MRRRATPPHPTPPTPTIQPINRPLVLRPCPQRLVEGDGRGVPVQDRPLQAAVAAGYADAGQFYEEGLAVAAASVGGAYVQVLQVNAVHAAPRREVEEPEREARRFAGVRLGDVRVRGRVLAEQRLAQLLLRRPRLVRALLVLGQFADHGVDDGDVFGRRGTNHGRRVARGRGSGRGHSGRRDGEAGRYSVQDLSAPPTSTCSPSSGSPSSISHRQFWSTRPSVQARARSRSRPITSVRASKRQRSSDGS